MGGAALLGTIRRDVPTEFGQPGERLPCKVADACSPAHFRHRKPLAHAWRKTGVRMLIIDEFHAVLTSTYWQQRGFLNSIRFPANDLEASMI